MRGRKYRWIKSDLRIHICLVLVPGTSSWRLSSPLNLSLLVSLDSDPSITLDDAEDEEGS